MIINPRYAEADHSLRFDDPLENPLLLIFRMFSEYGYQGVEDFFDGLVKLKLPRIPLLDGFIYLIYIIASCLQACFALLC
ncbi:hypothetical protein D3C73_1589620 [compost metagenome]